MVVATLPWGSKGALEICLLRTAYLLELFDYAVIESEQLEILSGSVCFDQVAFLLVAACSNAS